MGPFLLWLKAGVPLSGPRNGTKTGAKFLLEFYKNNAKNPSRGSRLAGGFLVLLGLVEYAVGCCFHELAQVKLAALLPLRPYVCCWYLVHFISKRTAQHPDCGGPL